MNKTELVHEVAERASISKADAERAIKALLATVSSQLAEGGSVALTGFGTFSQRFRKARKGRNPKTGQEIQIKSVKVPYFKTGKTLKDTVNK